MDASGPIFGKYDIIRRIAVGGMGEVFLARQTGIAGFDRLVILKSLLPDLMDRTGAVEQFLNEARVAATLNHPNIVAVYEVGHWNGTYYIAMEHIHGEDAARVLREAGESEVQVPPHVAARIVADAALGLDHAHRATDVHGTPLNIVHRDVSPHNIMVRGDGVTKVVDFGIAKAKNAVMRTATGLLKGKVPYMSPEQLDGQALDGRSDQFSLGVVLWELCTGRGLFRGNNELAVMKAILSGDVPRPSGLVSGFPPDLEAILMRMLCLDRDLRYPSCLDVARALESLLSTSRRSGPRDDVAVFVQGLMGEQLAERVRGLPLSEQNYLISFADGRERRAELDDGRATAVVLPISDASSSAETASLEIPALHSEVLKPSPPAGRVRLVVGAAVVVSVALLAAWLAWRDERVDVATPLPPSTPAVATAAPPAPPVAREVATPDPTSVVAPVVEPNAEAKPAAEKARPQRRPERPRARPSRDLKPASTGFAELTLSTTPWSSVTIDGRAYGSTPLFKIRLPSGSHRVHLVNEESGIAVTRTLHLAPGQEARLSWSLKQEGDAP